MTSASSPLCQASNRLAGRPLPGAPAHSRAPPGTLRGFSLHPGVVTIKLLAQPTRVRVLALRLARGKRSPAACQASAQNAALRPTCGAGKVKPKGAQSLSTGLAMEMGTPSSEGLPETSVKGHHELSLFLNQDANT